MNILINKLIWRFFMGTSFLKFHDNYDSNMFIYQCGWESCSPYEGYGPDIRDHYLIHFIISGEGTFTINNKTYIVKTNEGFLITPNEATSYQSSASKPWSYLWVGFNGVKASQYLKQMGVDKHNPIIRTNNPECIKSYMHKINKSSTIANTNTRELRMRGYLFLLLSEFIDSSPLSQLPNFKDNYIKKSMDYIELNYNHAFTVNDLANHVGLNRSYFSNLFKKHTDLTPMDFIIKYKITKACELMQKDTTLSIASIAESVGYSNLVSFSKAFKKFKGMSPSKFKNTILTE